MLIVGKVHVVTSLVTGWNFIFHPTMCYPQIKTFISSKSENVLTRMHVVVKSGQLNRFVHYNLIKSKFIVLLEVEETGYCSFTVQQVNNDLERQAQKL